MKKSKSTNPTLISEIETLAKNSREKKAPIWRDLAIRLTKSSSRRKEVNLSQISKHTTKGETAAIPGKVLGAGNIDHAITAAAFSFQKTQEKR